MKKNNYTTEDMQSIAAFHRVVKNYIKMDKISKNDFAFNENIIWDSGFGYEIGRFLGEGNQKNTWLIDVRSGLINEPCSHPKCEVYKYTDELIDLLMAKYGYEKRFSKIF